MRIEIDLNPKSVAKDIVEQCSHKEAEELIIAMDSAMQDYDFTLKLIRKLVKSLRTCDDPSDPLKPGDIW